MMNEFEARVRKMGFLLKGLSKLGMNFNFAKSLVVTIININIED